MNPPKDYPPHELPFLLYLRYYEMTKGLEGHELIVAQGMWWYGHTQRDGVLGLPMDELLQVPAKVMKYLDDVADIIAAAPSEPIVWNGYVFRVNTDGMIGEEWLDLTEVGTLLANNTTERQLHWLCLLMRYHTETKYSGEFRVKNYRADAELCPAVVASHVLLSFTGRLQLFKLASPGSTHRKRKEALQATKERWKNLPQSLNTNRYS